MIQTLDPEIMSASWQTLYNQLYQKSDSMATFIGIYTVISLKICNFIKSKTPLNWKTF